MTATINLTQLRANTEAIHQGSERHNDAASMLTVAQALALIDTAEAAIDHLYEWDRGDDAPHDRLRESLGRYTT